ncbi:FtsW/RodA/SpoVE family cell cycle protein [uncultured Rummeliibacillus sp.]|uniref:FtsW/RodA/SpoVE family cell cycle protein n=1 Tax=uncultured Rummeliibacillus sp. TaxID=762292 RepID=UPI002636E88B|nr:FtsW/RodA/SpoVE family cell cycle protein [uncultured Rummeliibacillus sp.]
MEKLKLDKAIMVLIVLFAMISCLFIYSSNSVFNQYSGSFIWKQLIFYIIGLSLMVGISRLDLEQLLKLAWPIYWILMFLLIALIFAPESIAKPINSAKSWYQVPFIGTFQPSEFMKFAFILVVGKITIQHHKIWRNQTIGSDLWLLSKMAIITLPPILIVYKQPDTGMIMLYGALLFAMVLFSGIHRRIVYSLLAIPMVIVTTLLIVYINYQHFFNEKILGKLSPHQISRINGWLKPFEYGDSAFQTRKGILAIGSGLTTGKGYLGNNVYIPEKHTDFIFAAIAEEMGFIGGAVVVILFFLLIYRIVMITIHAELHLATIMGVGIIGLLAFQVFQNIGMTMGLLPVTGVTLPFLSYGGSSLLSNFLLLGIILVVKNSYEGYMFKKDNGEESYAFNY